MQISAPLNSEPSPILQRVEVATSRGLPAFYLIGLVGPEVAEARERVRAAILASNLEFPKMRIVVNLSPANIRKRGTGVDLAMALAILATPDLTQKVVAAGELGLDGSVKPVGQMTRSLFSAWKGGADLFFFAQEDLSEAVEALQILRNCGEFEAPFPQLAPISSLSEAWQILQKGSVENTIFSLPERPFTSNASPFLLPITPQLERIVGTAASGRHHLLLLGAKGVGKSQALEWLIALQPRADASTRLHHRLIGELASGPIRREEIPIRRVGAQVRPSTLIGGISDGFVRPGEFSLAHGGLLIADELPEWHRDSRESLREPLERGWVTVSRSHSTVELPARFILGANGNLCPCGTAPVPCNCDFTLRRDYLRRVSGPILDRIDMSWVLREDRLHLKQATAGKLTELRARVETAHQRARRTWGAPAGLLESSTLEELLRKHPDWNDSLQGVTFTSLRSRHKIVRLALSLAAWDERNDPLHHHFVEATLYRPESLMTQLNEDPLSRATHV